MLHKYGEVGEIIKCHTEDSLPGLNSKVMVGDMGNILLTVLYVSCLFPSGFPSDSKEVLHHLISTCKDPPFYARGRSFYNPEQLDSNCPGEVQKAVGRKASLQALALLSAER